MARRYPAHSRVRGQVPRDRRSAERDRKRIERRRLASAAYSFIEVHPEFSGRWHPIYDKDSHTYRLSRIGESDWRRFLRDHRWQVGEKGREGRISRSGSRAQGIRPLSRAQAAARERFHTEALGRSPESFRGVYT